MCFMVRGRDRFHSFALMTGVINAVRIWSGKPLATIVAAKFSGKLGEGSSGFGCFGEESDSKWGYPAGPIAPGFGGVSVRSRGGRGRLPDIRGAAKGNYNVSTEFVTDGESGFPRVSKVAGTGR